MKKKMHSLDPSVSRMLRNITLICIAGYLLLVALFYSLTGEQLFIRQSRRNLALPAADTGTVELSTGNSVEQHFLVDIDIIQRICVQWGTYYRPNAGTVTMELRDGQTGELLAAQNFDAAAITEGSITLLTEGMPIKGKALAPLTLRVFSPDGQLGSSVSPLMSTQEKVDYTSLTINGAETEGILCFSVEGMDYNWVGLHFWQLAVLGFVLLLAALAFMWAKQYRGKTSYLVSAILALRQYRFLIRQLVSRDFKTKYKRSFLGMVWSFLNPLLTMLVQYFVFSTIFRADIPFYAAYLLIGVVLFNFFNEVCNMSLFSILGNASLITKVYMPKYIYPLTRVLSSIINLGIALIPMILVCLITGVQFKKSAILALFFILCLMIFCMGMAFLLSSAMVFFRDTQFLWSVFSMLWMYATPIFYPESILPENFRFILKINPLYHFLKNVRICILDGISPEPNAYFQCLLIALAVLGFGAWVFKKCQDKFVLYL